MSNDYESTFIFQRICIRCQQPTGGWSYSTLYGYIVVDGKKIHSCGDALHHHCIPKRAVREVYRGPGTGTGKDWSRPYISAVAPGIDFNEHTKEYYPRSDARGS